MAAGWASLNVFKTWGWSTWGRGLVMGMAVLGWLLDLVISEGFSNLTVLWFLYDLCLDNS